LPTGFKGRDLLRIIGCDYRHGKKYTNISFFNVAERSCLVPVLNYPTFQKGFAEEYMGRQLGEGDLLEKITRMDFNNYLCEDILVKTDRASMLNSLELRSPFLSKKIIEFAFQEVDSKYKVTQGHRKILLRSLAKKLLPENYNYTRKQGFSIPLADWLRKGEWRDFVLSVLYDEKCIFDKKVVRNLVAGLDIGRNNQERIFSLVMFELWRRDYGISI
jgi:asparagine synthase (glutamine-hydrolysing)